MKDKILVIITIILAFITGGVLTYLVFFNNIENSTRYNSCSNCMSGTMVVENGGIKETVKKVYDAVVMVRNVKNGESNGSGSGFVYKTDSKYGYILTNQHVIEGATSIPVLMTSGEEIEATIVGEDKYLDVAVLRIPKENVIAVAKLGSSKDLEVGETIVVIGTPINKNYFNSVTGGYISGLNRKVTASVDESSDWVQDVIQFDAPINPGNSGGALVNFNGEVIGVITMKFINENIEAMSFAIKIDDVKKHLTELEKGEEIERPFIGITYANLTDTTLLSKYSISLKSKPKHGIVVLDVVSGSAAEKVGIKVGDIVTKIDGEDVENIAHLKYLLFKHAIGDKIKVTLIRDTKEMNKELTLTATKEG